MQASLGYTAKLFKQASKQKQSLLPNASLAIPFLGQAREQSGGDALNTGNYSLNAMSS